MISRRSRAGRGRGRCIKGSTSAIAPPDTPLTIISSVTVNFWHRADLGVTTATGVTAWDDQTANNRDWVQAGAGSIQPALNTGGPGGRSYITLDGIDDYMTNAFAPPGGGASGFLWMVMRRNTGAGSYWINGSSSGTNRFTLQGDGAATSRMNNSTSAQTLTAHAVSTWQFVWANFTGTTSDELKIGSAAAATGVSAGTLGSSGGLWLGCTGALTGFGGYDLAEIGHCAGKPTELAALKTYIDTWYGGAIQT